MEKIGTVKKTGVSLRTEIDQSIRKMTLYDRGLFASTVRRSPRMTETVLNAVLSMGIRLRNVTAESFVPNTEGKSPVLDAIAIGDGGSVYGIEMQRRGEDFPPERIRYYQAMMDSGLLGKGEDYRSLPKSCIIVFFEKGIPGMRGPVEVFVTKNRDTNIPFEDGRTIVLVDGSYRGEDGLGTLLKDMSESDPDKIVTREIREQMLYFKKGEGRKEMSESIERLIRKAERMAEERGRADERASRDREIADRMSSKGLTREEIFDLTGIKA